MQDTQVAPVRFVNLNKAPCYIQDARGSTVMVRPFGEALNENTRRADATYVLEGAFWNRYTHGGRAGPLHPFPVPASFGIANLPPIQVHHFDGRADDGRTRTDGSSMDAVAVRPLPGKIRAAGDVITPTGKIRRRNPDTGVDEEVDDTPANRSVLKPINPPGIQEPPAKLKRSIIDYLEEHKIASVEQFDALTDAQLLSVPGMNPLALPRLRANMRSLLIAQATRTGAVIAPSGDEDEEAGDSPQSAAKSAARYGSSKPAGKVPAKPAAKPVSVKGKALDTVSKKSEQRPPSVSKHDSGFKHPNKKR